MSALISMCSARTGGAGFIPFLPPARAPPFRRSRCLRISCRVLPGPARRTKNACGIWHWCAAALFRIHFHKSRQVDDDEEQIAELVFDAFLRTASHHGFELGAFLIQLGQNFADVRPVESGAGCARGDLLGLHECRQSARDRIEQAGWSDAFLFLLFGLDLAPTLADVALGTRGFIGKDVRVTPDQLGIDGVDWIFDVEMPALGGHFGEKRTATEGRGLFGKLQANRARRWRPSPRKSLRGGRA